MSIIIIRLNFYSIFIIISIILLIFISINNYVNASFNPLNSIKLRIKPLNIKISSFKNFNRNNIIYNNRYAISGGIATSLTHLNILPIDVIKNRMQLNPINNSNLINTINNIIKSEGIFSFYSAAFSTIVAHGFEGFIKVKYLLIYYYS